MLDQQRKRLQGGRLWTKSGASQGLAAVLAPAPLGRHERLVTASSPPEETSTTCAPHGLAQQYKELKMNLIINTLMKLGIRKYDLDYHFIRASMVIIFLFFGYQKWFAYEAQALLPYISHGPLISWMYPVFGVRGA